MRHTSLISFLLLFALSGFAQNSDEELAAQYFSEGEYDKAEILYKRLLKKDESSVYIYQNYLECLIRLKSFGDAEKMVGKQRKRFPDKPLYDVDLGYIYQLQSNEKKATQLFNGLVKRSGQTMPQTEQLAMAFMKRDMHNYAIETYLKGRKSLNDEMIFAENLIDLYYDTKDYQSVINECLAILTNDDRSFELVQSKLIYLVDNNIETAYLNQRVSLHLQQNPENIIFDDLLMWVYIQQKKFRVALRQALAMDKRNNSEGRSLVNLAKICVSNQAYQVAIDAYQKVIEFGPEGYFYMSARMGLLETSFIALKSDLSSSQEDVDELITKYDAFISVFGNSWNTAPTVKELADIYIFYKHDLNKGISLLEQMISIPRLQPHLQGKYKLSLGDAYLMRNDVWDAALLYGQVDKAFKEDPLGQEAKFRNARLSYFQGDFEWSKDQLDVLKTATSQLISNNAIELALTIQDNTGLDSTTDALTAYAEAELLLFQNRLDDCLTKLDLLPFKYPQHSLEDEIYYTKAQVMEKKQDFKKAEEYYLNVVNYFGTDILADNAVYRLAMLYQNTLDEPQKAIEMYEKLIFNYSGSLFVVDARKRYKKLKSSLLLEETTSP